MSITFYEPPPTPADEERRARAVDDSRAIEASGDPVLGEIALEARDQLQADMSVVSIIQGDYQHLIAASGLPLGIYSRRTSFCGHAVASGEALYCIPDLTADRRFAFNPWVTGENGDNASMPPPSCATSRGWRSARYACWMRRHATASAPSRARRWRGSRAG